MRPFAFLLAVGSLLMLSLPADAQLFGRRSYGTCAGGNCGNSGYSTPMAYSQPPVVTSTPSTAYSAPRPSTYSVGANGQVISPDGNPVKSLGGVPIMARAYFDSELAKAQDDAMSFAAVPTCECKDYSADIAEIKATLKRIERNQQVYRDQQSKADREFEQLAAEQAAKRAVVLARIEGRSLALR